ncbi:hypothetical protein [Chitinophaga caseinilytica]|uniref:Uncharacterized protein n=1 Tax=Chitinophaga caseinilytica TaxID=2267521 RepID=A0ABZ2YX18_9BACT
MPQFTLKPFLFFRTVLFYLAATIAWTVAAIRTQEFGEPGEGFILELGYLLILGFSLVVGMRNFRSGMLVMIPAGVILIFLIATFVLGLALLAMHAPVWIYFIMNAAFVSVAMTWLIDWWDELSFRKWTIVLTGGCLLIGYLLIGVCKSALEEEFNIKARMSMFLIFQTVLIIPLAFGMAVEKLGAEQENM